ncbi:hypothetical protein JYU34_000543 [Plutella xylostella]|uniref:Uncharacterized protein n=1 Tax=Plutella xylostella TaxID=51655 RepID=A0ABQ7R7Y9_PLUXY|nr:hypothetical protein JYU34_000543 [Plutella xylostella]
MEDGLIKKGAGSYFHPHNEPVVELRQGGAAAQLTKRETTSRLIPSPAPLPAPPAAPPAPSAIDIAMQTSSTHRLRSITLDIERRHSLPKPNTLCYLTTFPLPPNHI